LGWERVRKKILYRFSITCIKSLCSWFKAFNVVVAVVVTASKGRNKDMRYVYPLDPDCPKVASFTDCLFDDPMTEAMGAPTDDIMEGFSRKHRKECKRCQEFGAANVDVE
jgi:hypothetical protein